MLAASPPRPPLYFRVGITGTRDQRVAEAARPALAQILTLVKDEISGLAGTEAARVFYHHEGDTPIGWNIVFVSPLAEGADRVAAEEALRLGYGLKAPLPFAPDEYEKDFRTTVADFRRLLKQAEDRVVLDGVRGDSEKRSYEAVGRFVVNNSDLLIAVWDGNPSKGRGGTGDIVELAVDLGVPVIHVPIDGIGEFRLTETWLQLQGETSEIADVAVDLVVGVGEPRLIAKWLQLRRPNVRDYQVPLRQLISRTILPSTASDEPGVASRFPALQTYWREQLAEAERRKWFSGFYDWNVRWLTNFGDWLETNLNFGNWLEKSVAFGEHEALDPHRLVSPPTPGFAEEWWSASYEPADQLSHYYGTLYRSSYVAILYFAFFALSLAVLAMLISAYLKVKMLFSLFEFIFIILIALFWVSNWWCRWHERWISYRLLAELCRKQKVLAPLGRSLPRWEIEHLGSEVDIREEAWVGWYFSAMARAAPFPRGDLRDDALEHARKAGLEMLHDQIAYHIARGRLGKAEVALRVLSFCLFGLAAVCVLIEIGLECLLLAGYSPTILDVPAKILGVLAAILPTASAFFFGIRAYAEFELLADESARMHREMCDSRDELEEMRFDRPLASQVLGARIFRAATLMMQDIHGWAQLFRVKHVETH